MRAGGSASRCATGSSERSGRGFSRPASRRRSPAWIQRRSTRRRCRHGPRPCSTHAPPGWISSPLTFELAEEIWLREGRTAADPDRDAGAYRFLFEHRLIHCLELYQRMLLWMAWLWKFSGRGRAVAIGAGAGLSALGRAIRRSLASLHRRADDAKPRGRPGQLRQAGDPRTDGERERLSRAGDATSTRKPGPEARGAR